MTGSSFNKMSPSDIDPDEETLQQREEVIILSNVGPEELEKFAAFREKISQIIDEMVEDDPEVFRIKLSDYADNLQDYYDVGYLEKVFLYHLLLDNQVDRSVAEQMERYDVEDEDYSIEKFLETMLNQ